MDSGDGAEAVKGKMPRSNALILGKAFVHLGRTSSMAKDEAIYYGNGNGQWVVGVGSTMIWPALFG